MCLKRWLKVRYPVPCTSNEKKLRENPSGGFSHLLYMFDPVPRKIGGALDAGTIRRMTAATYQSKHEADQSLDGFELDKDLSTPEQKIYHNPTTKETVVAHRGTKGLGDWTNNAAYLVGRYGQTKRYQRAKKKQQEVIDKYGKVTTTLGHSQGAIISRKLNNNFPQN